MSQQKIITIESASGDELFHYCLSSNVVSDPAEYKFTEDFTHKQSTLTELIKFLNSGYGVLPYKLKEGTYQRSLKNFDFSHLVFFDIDEGISLESGLQIFKNQCIAIYTTRSHQKSKIKKVKINGLEVEVPVICDRFRVVCAVDERLNISMLKLILKAGVFEFGHDKQCVDASKGYLTLKDTTLKTFPITNRLDVKSLLENYQAHSSFSKFIKSLVKLHCEYKSEQELIEDINSKFGTLLSIKSKANYREKDKKVLTLKSPSINNIKEIENNGIFPAPYNNILIESGKIEHKSNEILNLFTINGSRNKSNNKNYRRIRDVNFDFLKSYCKLLQNPNSTDHGEMRHLLLNFNQFEGGNKQILKILKDRPHRENRPEKYHASLIRQIKNNDCPVSFCANYCSYHKNYGGSCDNPGNLVTLELERRKKVTLLNKEKKYITLQEGRDLLKIIFEKIKSKVGNDITAVLAQTGIGKTFLLETIQESEGKQYIVGPSYRQLKTMNIGFLYPELPLSLMKKIKHFSDLGISRLKLFKEESFLESLTDTDLQHVNEYLEKVEAAKKAKIVRITHERFLTDPDIMNEINEVSHVWIDEDIIESILKIDSISVQELKTFRNQLKNEISNSDRISPYSLEFLDKMLKNVDKEDVFSVDHELSNKIKKHDIEQLNAMAFKNARELSRSDIESTYSNGFNLLVHSKLQKAYINIFKLLNADFYYYFGEKIHILRKRSLPSNSKIAIFSATINVDEYKILFGDRVKFEIIPDIKPMAKLIQNNKWSFSKTSIFTDEKRANLLEDLIAKAKINNFNILSFKAISENNASNIYFYASEGIRGYEGEKLLVIGTPHPTIPYLKLRSESLGYDTQSIRDFNSSSVESVDYKDYRLKLKIFSSDPNIIKMQLNFIEKHLIQAIGRARIYSHPGLVLLFSNFPISDFIQYEYSDMIKISELFIECPSNDS